MVPTNGDGMASEGGETEIGGRRKIRSLRDGSTKAVQRRGFGTLDNPSGVLPKLTPPGQAKRQESERREQAANTARGGSGNEKQRWDAVVAILKHFEKLAVA